MQSTTTLPDPLLTEAQVAAILGVKPTTLQVWRSTRRYAFPYIKSGRLVRYRASAVEAFIAARTVGDSEPATI